MQFIDCDLPGRYSFKIVAALDRRGLTPWPGRCLFFDDFLLWVQGKQRNGSRLPAHRNLTDGLREEKSCKTAEVVFDSNKQLP